MQYQQIVGTLPDIVSLSSVFWDIARWVRVLHLFRIARCTCTWLGTAIALSNPKTPNYLKSKQLQLVVNEAFKKVPPGASPFAEHNLQAFVWCGHKASVIFLEFLADKCQS